MPGKLRRRGLDFQVKPRRVKRDGEAFSAIPSLAARLEYRLAQRPQTAERLRPVRLRHRGQPITFGGMKLHGGDADDIETALDTLGIDADVHSPGDGTYRQTACMREAETERRVAARRQRRFAMRSDQKIPRPPAGFLENRKMQQGVGRSMKCPIPEPDHTPDPLPLRDRQPGEQTGDVGQYFRHQDIGDSDDGSRSRVSTVDG